MSLSPVGFFQANERVSVYSYESNAHAALQKIAERFIEAIQKVNSEAEKFGNPYKLFVCEHWSPRRGGISLGDKFEDLLSFSVWIDKGPEMDYSLPFKLPGKVSLHLGVIVPCADSERLRKMALSGEIAEFEEVYTNWVAELGAELTFFHENYLAIERTKEKISNIFNQAIVEAIAHFQSKKYPGSLIVDQFSSPGKTQKEYEPLKDCGCWVRENEYYDRRIGCVKIIKSREEFKQILNDEIDLKEIFKRCSAEMKDRLDASFAPIWFHITKALGWR